MKDVFYSILGYIPYIGDVSSLLLTIKGVSDRAAKQKINECGRCAKIINTYSREWGTTASLVTGWSDRYSINVYDENNDNEDYVFTKLH